VRVYLGPKPTDSLPPDRLRAWAKLDFLVTQPDYSGRARVYINNLQTGDENLAVRNALNMTAAELDAKVDAFLARGVFNQASLASEPINPNRDYVEKRLSQAQVSDLLAELDAAGKSFPPGSPRWLLGEGTPTSLEAAGKANPRWGEPHFRLAALLDVPLAKVSELQIAASLEPGKSEYWQALAKAQTAVGQDDAAAKSWASAEHAAPTPAEAERIHQARLAADDRKTDFVLAARKRSADEEAADLQRVKDAAAARLHATENEINQRLGPLDSKQPVAKWDEFERQTLIGKVTRIDCVGTAMKFTVQPSIGQGVALWMPDPKAFFASTQKTFTCGVPKQPIGVRIIHDTKADPKQGTAGEIRSIDTL